MRLVTLADGSRPAALATDGDVDRVLDLSGIASSTLAVLTDDALLDAAREAVSSADAATVPARDEVRLAAPVVPGKIICIGYNYRGHVSAKSSLDAPDPEFPDVFVKTPNVLRGPDDVVEIPAQSEHVDYEGEIALVIGRTALNVPEEDALSYVAGYTLFDDITARDWQDRTSQWTLGKNFDGFGPLGPAVVTPDEIADPADLVVEVVREGQVTVSQSTSTLIFPFARLIHYVTQAITLEPGDIISTGTPQKLPEAGAAHRPLASGDAVTVRVAGIGELTTTATPRATAPRRRSRPAACTSSRASRRTRRAPRRLAATPTACSTP